MDRNFKGPFQHFDVHDVYPRGEIRDLDGRPESVGGTKKAGEPSGPPLTRLNIANQFKNESTVELASLTSIAKIDAGPLRSGPRKLLECNRTPGDNITYESRCPCRG